MVLLDCCRPPSGKIEIFVDDIHDILDNIPQIDEFELYICGDFNIPYNLVTSSGYKKIKIPGGKIQPPANDHCPYLLYSPL